MATKCPNKNSEEWKLLVSNIGEIEAYGIFIANSEEVPEMSICKEIVKKYNKVDNIQYNSQGEVLAPNGNVSKLYKDIEKLEGVTNKQQALQLYKQTRSKEFKEWFGNSKVMDENSEPLIVYHGSKAQFDIFDNKGRINFDTINSIESTYFFTDNTIQVKNYGDIIYPVFLKIINPKHEISSGEYINDMDVPISEAMIQMGVVSENKGGGFIKKNEQDVNKDGIILNIENEGRWVKRPNGEQVFSGVMQQQVQVVFKPNQIKSVFNQGTFSSLEDNIYKSKDLDIQISETSTLNEVSDKIEQLQQVFKQYGINVPVVIDNDLQVKGEIRIVNGKPTIHIRSDIFNDTVEHEFAHLYIELLGNDNVVTSAINQLKDTPLWNKVKEKYSELNDIKLGKEVLATAMGLHDSDIFKEVTTVEKGNSIIRLLKAIFAKIQKLLGIEPSIAKRLVNEMLSGKLRKEIDINNLSNFTYQSKEMNDSGMPYLINKGTPIEVAKDVLGNELDHYIDRSGKIKTKLRRVTDDKTGLTREFLPIKSNRLPVEDYVDRLWLRYGAKPEDKLQLGAKDKKTGVAALVTQEEMIKKLNGSDYINKADGRIAELRTRQEVEMQIGEKEAALLTKKAIDLEHEKLIKEGLIEAGDQRMNHIHYTIKGTTDRLIVRAMNHFGINTFNGEYKPGISDKPYFQVKVFNELLGFAGSADMWFEHADGTITRLELKSGRKIANEDPDLVSFLSLMYTNKKIDYSEMNKAKLQDMLYAVLAKSMNPQLQFRAAYVPLLNSKWSLDKVQESKVTAKETTDMLEMIENALKDKKFIERLNENSEHKIPLDIHKKLVDSSPNIFNPKHYTVESIGDGLYNEIYNNEIKGQDGIQKQEYITRKLQMRLNGVRIAIQEGANTKENRAEEISIVEQLLQLNAKGRNLVLNPDEGLGTLEGQFSSLQHFKLPVMKVLANLKDERRTKINTTYRRRMFNFDKVTIDMVKEWCVKNNVSYNRFFANFNLSQLSNHLGVYDGLTVFEDEGKYQGDSRERLLIVYSKDDAILKSLKSENYTTIGDYVVRKDDVELFNSSSMTDTRRKWLVEANKLSYHYFVNKGDTKAYWNTVYSHANPKTEKLDEKSDRTVGEVYNDKKTDRYFEYFEGWFPRIWEQPEELEYRTGFEVTKSDNTKLNYVIGWLYYPFKHFNEWQHRRLTRYLDYNFEDYGNLGYGLPLKFLGNSSMNRNKTYSKNLGLAFSAFTKGIEFKKEMDDVYVLGKGMEAYLEAQGNGRFYKAEIDWLHKALPYELTGLTTAEIERENIASSKVSFTGHKVYNIDWTKVARGLSLWATKSFMAGRIKSAAGNTIHASIVTWQNALKDDIAQGKIPLYGKSGKLDKFIGIDGNEIDFDREALDFGVQAYMNLLKDYANGNYRNNKLWLFGQKIRVLPEDFNFNVPYDMQIVRNKLMNSNNWAFIFHGIGEEAISYITAASQLYNMKHSKETAKYSKQDIEKIVGNEGNLRQISRVLFPGKNFLPKEGDRKRIWDSYEVKDGELVWTGGTRGVIITGNKGNEIVTELTELDSRELRRFNEVYQQLQGAYKADENTTFGSTMAGIMFMPLKKWLPSMIRRMFGAETKKEELGFYKPSLADIQSDMKNTFDIREINGQKEPVMEWHARVIEGRLRTLAKILMYLSSKPLVATGILNKRWQPGMEKLTSEQKKNLIELHINFLFWMTMWLMWQKGFKDTDDDDTIKKWVKQYMIDNPSQVWNISDMAKTMQTAVSPVALVKLAKSVENTGNLFGHLTGATLGFKDIRNVQGNIPYLRREADIWWFSSMMRQFTDDALHSKSIFDIASDNKLR